MAYFFILILIILEIIFIFFACGIRIHGYFDISLGCLCFDMLIFKKFKWKKIKIFECKNQFYIQVNRKRLETVSSYFLKKKGKKKKNEKNIDDKKRKKTSKKGVLDILKQIENEQIVIDRLNFNFAYSSTNLLKTGIAYGMSEIFVGLLKKTCSKYADILENNINFYTNAQTDNLKINFDCIVKFGMLQIFFLALRILKKRRTYG